MYICSVGEYQVISANEKKYVGQFDCTLPFGEKRREVKRREEKRRGPENSQPDLFPKILQCVSLLQPRKEYASARELTSFLPHPKGRGSRKLGRNPLRPARTHCGSACPRNELLML